MLLSRHITTAAATTLNNSSDVQNTMDNFLYRNNWTRRITGAEMVERRSMNDLKEKIGLRFSIAGRLARNRIIWEGHLVPMEAGRLPKRARA